jgi:hypothetical protein
MGKTYTQFYRKWSEVKKISYTEHAQQFSFFFSNQAEIIFIHSGDFRGFC